MNATPQQLAPAAAAAATAAARVAVVIPTYKRPGLLVKAVNSVLAQGASVGEVIVVDDNDEPRYSAETSKALDAIADPRLRLISNQRRKGGCGSRNTGIVSASCDYVAFLDDDDSYYDGAVDAHLRAFDRPGLCMVYGAAKIVDEIYDATSYVYPSAPELTTRDMIEGRCPRSSSIVMAKREALLQAGLFDESLPSFQDYDMWLKLLRVGRIAGHRFVVAEFVQHSDDRVSVNIDRRVSGLDMICQKWRQEISAIVRVDRFKRRYLAAAYSVNGLSLLSQDLHKRWKAISYLTKAAVFTPSYKLNYVGWLLLGVLGFRATKFAVRLKSSRQAVADGMPATP